MVYTPPFYDLIGNLFNDDRCRSIQLLNLQSGERVLLLGAGTGIDLKFLPDDIRESVSRRVANAITGFFFSEINRQLQPILATVPLDIFHEESARFENLGYRITVLRKSVYASTGK
ncbi:MAG: hypothetical protein CL610_15775 [Anaerolineaceae bacterium]|nr:hypothetical protein [Anaerolineaceae bacterium]